MNDSYGQSEGIASAEAVRTHYADEVVEQPTDAAELIIDTFPIVLDGGRVKIWQRWLRRGKLPGGGLAGSP